MNAFEKFYSIIKEIGQKLKAFKNIFNFLGKNAFLFLMALIIIDVFIGFLIFYKYVYLENKKEPEIGLEIIKFDTKSFQKVLQSESERQEKLQNLPEKYSKDEYLNPFLND